jgi:DnaK suppressor protein
MTVSLSPALALRIREQLADREQQLLAMLHRSMEPGAAIAGVTRDVSDFKDAAVEESQAVVDDAQAAHAARELGQVHSAMRRLDDGTYGECLDCGEAIEIQRLAALPATTFCTSCQSAREHEHATAARR